MKTRIYSTLKYIIPLSLAGLSMAAQAQGVPPPQNGHLLTPLPKTIVAPESLPSPAAAALTSPINTISSGNPASPTNPSTTLPNQTPTQPASSENISGSGPRPAVRGMSGGDISAPDSSGKSHLPK
ncbi:hypothetical protein [Paraherbaspirillum soli]|uniref:Uncharacterized protein n=1 Tax=Paraherbaspirillum soli TaxID=631222 RepID=A0ABW0MCA4_9BURK